MSSDASDPFYERHMMLFNTQIDEQINIIIKPNWVILTSVGKGVMYEVNSMISSRN